MKRLDKIRLGSKTIIPVGILIFVLYGIHIFRGEVLFWGAPSLQFVPWWQRVLLNLQHGNLPLWNQDVGMGAPLLANYQVAFFYPLNWLYIIAGKIGGPQGIGWSAFAVIAIHISWAALGMFKVCSVLGLSRFAQIISAMAFGFSGYLVARAWFLSINAAVSWLPWILLFSYQLIRILKNTSSFGTFVWWRNSSFWLLIICVCMQLLSGHAQTTFYTLVLLIAWSIFWLVSSNTNNNHLTKNISAEKLNSGTGWKTFVHISIVIGIAICIAVGIAAIQLVPTAEYLIQSSRSSEVDFEIAMTYSMWPWRLIGLFAPNFFGNPVFDNFWGYGNFWEDAIYIGLIPIFLSLSVLVGKAKAKNQQLRYFLGMITVTSMILALGKNTPIYPFLYEHVPTFDMFQAPTRWSLLGIFALSLLAGIGSESWLRPTGRTVYWSRLGTAGAFAITLGAGLAWLLLRGQSDTERLTTMVGSVMFTGLLLFTMGLLTLAAPETVQKPGELLRWHWIVITVICVDLCIAGWGLSPGGDRLIYPDPEEFQQLSDSGRIYMNGEDENYLKFVKYFRFETFNAVEDWTLLQETLLPNNNSMLGTASVLNYDPLVTERLADYIELIESSGEPEKIELLNLANVSVVVKKDLTLPSGARITEVSPGPYLRWYSCARSYPDSKDQIQTFRLHLEELNDVLFLEKANEQVSTSCVPNPSVQLQLVDNQPQYKVIQVESDSSGWVFISESYYPGWKAILDGVTVDIVPANIAFQAVKVPEGDHRLELVYQPDSFKIGSTISITFVMISLVIISLIHQRNLTYLRRSQ